MSTVQCSEAVQWSADLPNYNSIRNYLQAMPEVTTIKIGQRVMTGRSLRPLQTIAEDFGVRIFADAKINETPENVVEIALRYLRFKPWMLNIMAGSLSTWELLDEKKKDALKRYSEICRKHGTIPCGVTVLTSKTEAVVRSEFNGRSPLEQVLHYVGDLYLCGITDVVCSPLEVAAIKKDFPMIDFHVPAVRLPGADTQDQVRVGTPGGTILAGATSVISGRDITLAKDPRTAFLNVCRHIEETLAV